MVEVLAGYCTEQFHGRGAIPIAKFQKRTPSLRKEWAGQPHPHPEHAYGLDYLEHRKHLELDAHEMHLVRLRCSDLKIPWAASVWDAPAARDVIGLDPHHVKIPSAHNGDWPLIEFVYTEWPKLVIISCGMATRAEISDLVRRLGPDCARTVLMACTSTYPCPFKDVCLGEMNVMQDAWGSKMAGIGFSGHHAGIAVDVAAMALGAEYLERHFTLNRSWKGTDHAASLEPDGMRKLLRDCAHVAEAMDRKPGLGMCESERAAREKLRG